MVSKRKPKQKGKYLGDRLFGKGDRKNCRGSGNRGGRGNAGRCKHKYTWATKYAHPYFGKHGFVNPTRKRIQITHLFAINREAVLGKLKKKENKHYFEFNGKVLATGQVTVPLMIRALSWSKRVEEKLKLVGGSIEKFEEKSQAIKT